MHVIWNHQMLPKEEVSIDIEDRGYQFGDGIYEVIRIYQGHPFEIQLHLQRLERSAKEMDIPLPMPLQELRQKLLSLIEKNTLVNGSIYIQITRGVAPRSHAFSRDIQPVLIAYTTHLERPFKAMEQGIKAITTEDIRWMRVDIKSLNLLGNVLAKQKALEAGVQEAIQLRNGFVTEGSSSNLFAITDHLCYTHPANQFILDGVTRRVILGLLPLAGLEVVEKPIMQADLYHMDEVFISSTTQEICPVTEIDGIPIGKGHPGSYTRRLQAQFDACIQQSVQEQS